jgi:uncharacterized delta-60 repeat protein
MLVVLFTLVVVLVPGLSLAMSPGDLDTTFGTTGVTNQPIGNADSEADQVRQLPDGSIVAAGYTQNASGHYGPAVFKFDADGNLDTTFNGGLGYHMLDLVPTAGANGSALDLLVQPNGRLLLAGQVDDFSSNLFEWVVARFKPTGALDTSFGGGDGIFTKTFSAYGRLSGAALQPNGKIVVAGAISSSTWRATVARLDANGTLDATFGAGGIKRLGAGYLFGVTLAPAGKIVTVGQTDPPGDALVWRLLPNGAPDKSFSGDGKLVYDSGGGDYLRDATVRSDGAIVAAGGSEPAGKNVLVMRILPKGKRDPAFNGGNPVSVNIGEASDGEALAIQPDGRIVVAGEAEAGPDKDLLVERYTSSGQLDTTFGGGDGYVIHHTSDAYDYAIAVTIEPTGRIVLGGGGDANYDLLLVGLVGDSGPSCTRFGTNGRDTLTGTAGMDVLCGMGGTDTLKGLRGPDYLEGGPGRDAAWYGSAATGVTANLTTGVSSSGDGPDLLFAIEDIAGSSHADSLTGNGGPNRLYGLGANDHLFGLAGNDYLNGGLGTDVCKGGTGSDTLVSCP